MAPGAEEDGAGFYAAIPVFDGFGRIMDPSLYRPLPADWVLGLTDVVGSTEAIAEGRYKAVNTAGAASIAAVANALGGRDFPFVFGGDGASFAVSAGDAAAATHALTATAAWVRDELGLTLRAAVVPVSAARAAGREVLVARFAASSQVHYAMFSGGGLGWAEGEMKRGAFTVPAAPQGTRPDLTGLSCRWEEAASSKGVILSIIVLAASPDDLGGFSRLVDQLLALAGEAGRPLPDGGPALRWPPTGLDLEARASRRAGEPLLTRLRLAYETLLGFAVLRLGVPVGGFDPRRYRRELVEKADFRKYDDALRMTLDCTPDLAARIEACLAAAEAAGIARFGLHRQSAALMTCIVPSIHHGNHLHFVDGAAGGYAAAARLLKPGA